MDAYEVLCDSTNRDEWLKQRAGGLGASEIASVLGMSPWSSALELFAVKTGQMEPPDFSDNERVFWGTKLERAIIDGYAERTGRQVKPFGMLLRSTRWPWLLATPDALTSDDGETWWPLQVKNIGSQSADGWEEGAPPYYRLQVQQEALVYGAPKSTAAALVAGQRLIWEDVEVDEVSKRQIVNLSEAFWQQVQAKTPPSIDATEATRRALAALYPKEDPSKVVHLAADLLDADARLQEAKDRIKAAENEKRAAENAIKAALGDGVLGVLPDGTQYHFRTKTIPAQQRACYSYRELRRKAANERE